MSMHEIQEGLGGSGKLGEGFVGLGILGAIGGGILVFMAVFLTWPLGNSGESVYADSLIAGALFMVMGIGFTVFGVMVMISGWARHHPGYDEHGAHPTAAQLED
jgi:hypothetical protein